MDDLSPRMPDEAAIPDQPPSPGEWETWLKTNGSKVLLFAKQQTRSHEDAEDVVQDALIRLHEKLHAAEFYGGTEAWLPYLYTSIRRLAIDLSRRDDRRKRREDSVSEDIESEQQTVFHPWFDSGSSDDETRRQLEAGLKALPPKFAEVIVMKIWGDQTFAQIGETLGISQNTAASRYRYGLEALRGHLASARRRGDLAI
ncbi:MAG: sigma-70 family RNA polymerase sigma factor [Akkermansiaceae bacterium]|jgi:RNA polymerase sigma-70 factor (ECF subfamily)|nr:sigma-70 family RNA polymerase sigma factor [Akkermansiaceae bacterium]